MFSFGKSLRTLSLATAAILLAASCLFAGKVKDLVFLHYWSGSLSGGINEMVDAYNRLDPPYHVQALPFQHESFKQSIFSMLESDSPPDVFSYWAGAKIRDLVDLDLVSPIDQVWDEANLDEIFPTPVAQACTYYGKKYGIPLTQHYVAFFYNQAIFDKYDIRPPQTWEQLLKICETLKSAGITPFALGTRERWPGQFWFDYLLLRTAGPEYRQRLMEGKASYNDPEVSTAFCYWRQLLDAGYFNHAATQLDWHEAASLVHSGEAAMTLMGTWIIGLYDGKLKWQQEKDYGFFRFPIMDRNVPMTALGPIDVMAVARKGNPTEVNQMLAYFSDPGPQMEMSRGSGALSPSLAIPLSFYTPMQGRILRIIRETPYWAFNYDLATPHEVAEIGLDGFKLFVNQPGDVREILPRLARQTRQAFRKGKAASGGRQK